MRPSTMRPGRPGPNGRYSVSTAKGTVLLLVLAGLLASGGAPTSAAARASVAPATAAAFSPAAVLAPMEATGSAAPQRTKVRMGMILSIGGTPFFITQDRGYFAAENL